MSLYLILYNLLRIDSDDLCGVFNAIVSWRHFLCNFLVLDFIRSCYGCLFYEVSLHFSFFYIIIWNGTSRISQSYSFTYVTRFLCLKSLIFTGARECNIFYLLIFSVFLLVVTNTWVVLLIFISHRVAC